jgi:hypothetical protein
LLAWAPAASTTAMASVAARIFVDMSIVFPLK